MQFETQPSTEDFLRNPTRQKMPDAYYPPLVKQNLPLSLHDGLLSTESSNLHLIGF